MHIHWQTWLAAGAILVCGAIIFLADQQSLPGLITHLYAFPNGDKLGHFCLMGGLSFCLNLAVCCRTAPLLGRPFLLGSLLATVAITLEEFSQLFIPGRTFDLLDLAASLVGIWLLGHVAGWLYKNPLQGH